MPKGNREIRHINGSVGVHTPVIAQHTHKSRHGKLRGRPSFSSFTRAYRPYAGGGGGRTRRTLFQIIENDDRSTECESTGGLNFARQKLLLALLAFSPTQWLTQLTISMSCFYLLALSPVQCIENVFLWSLSLSWLTIKRWSAPSGALWSLHPTHPGIVMSLILCLYHEYGTLSYDHHFFTHGLYTFRGVLKRELSVRSCKWWKWWTTPKSQIWCYAHRWHPSI